MRKEFNSQRTLLVHQHGRRFIVLEHQYGRRDVMWKRSIGLNASVQIHSGKTSLPRDFPHSLGQNCSNCSYAYERWTCSKSIVMHVQSCCFAKRPFMPSPSQLLKLPSIYCYDTYLIILRKYLIVVWDFLEIFSSTYGFMMIAQVTILQREETKPCLDNETVFSPKIWLAQ